MDLSVTFHGAVGRTTGSAHIIQAGNKRVLLDCGIKPGSGEFPYLEIPEFNIGALNAVVLSHAHLDPCGAIPRRSQAIYRHYRH